MNFVSAKSVRFSNREKLECQCHCYIDVQSGVKFSFTPPYQYAPSCDG